MAPRIQFARRKAAELITQLNIRSAPIPLRKIAKALKAEIHFEPFAGELSGMLHCGPNGENAVIGINLLHPNTRQRFTLAHEIAHLVLHSEKELHIDERAFIAFRDQTSALAIDDGEVEANQFAAALLMPEMFLRSDVEDIDSSTSAEDAIKELAEKYEVSEQAMTIRLSSLKMLI